ncbi:MAG: PKD domain-containing protein [Bacteroidetes bacterium]|nr:PKD domain-containing protein [Bacteroidota bacterium]
MNQNFFLCLLCLVYSVRLFSQTPISGIVNQYARVVAIDACEGRLTVSNAANFSEGDQVLLIQMKGTTINTSNTASFGNIEATGSAGFYEKNEILFIAGNVVYLKNTLLNPYDASGSVQLVSIPLFPNAVATDTLKALPWNGEMGGVLIFQADTLGLEAPIDVSGAGFRGASKVIVTSDCTFLTFADDFYYPTNNWRGSPKGEGIAAPVSGKEHGRGAQANGGGGGNDHNSGGGGGGNVSAGGIGGNQNSSGFGCDGEFAGRGGKQCPNEVGRIFLGGGGGAGHVDDTGAGSSGANGGGIAIILAGTVQGNGQTIFANGKTPPNAGGDGAGGGGAGGTVLLLAGSLNGTLNVEAIGGRGSNVSNPSDRCFGAGGGASGGRLLTNLPNFSSVNVGGGQAGVNNSPSGQCNGPSNGAAAGEAGVQGDYDNFPQSSLEIVAEEVLGQPVSATVCEGHQAVFGWALQGNFLQYQWQANDGSGWINLSNSTVYDGTATDSLTVSNPNSMFDGYQFRCLVTGPCVSFLYSETAMLDIVPLPQAGFDFTLIGNETIEFENASTDATSYLWDFGDGTTSTEANPVHTFPAAGQFQVTLTAFNGCGETTFSLTVQTGSLPQAMFIAGISSGCAPLTVLFQNQSIGSNLTDFNWIFEGGNPTFSTEENPVVVYNLPGVYDVTLTVTNVFGENTAVQQDFVAVFQPPVADFSFSVNGATVQFTNLTIGGTFFNWDFGDGNTSQEPGPVHVYTTEGVFTVTLTAGNPNCGSAVSYQIFIDLTDAGEVSVVDGITVFPNPASGELTFSLSKIPAGKIRGRLFDVQGRTLQEFEIFEKTTRIEVSGLPSGLYFLALSDGKSWRRIKIAKQ